MLNMQKRFFNAIIFFITITTFFLTNSQAADFQHTIKTEEIDFSWSIMGDSIVCQLYGYTHGWVAVGFNPTKKMKDANIIIGYVKDGKVPYSEKGDRLRISDEYGVSMRRHKKDTTIGGEDNIINAKGAEFGNLTKIEFTIPLNSGDSKDSIIIPDADTKIILAYGTKDSFRRKHKKVYEFTVNLSTGVVK